VYINRRLILVHAFYLSCVLKPCIAKMKSPDTVALHAVSANVPCKQHVLHIASVFIRAPKGKRNLDLLTGSGGAEAARGFIFHSSSAHRFNDVGGGSGVQLRRFN
jgi:hypothetical protein